MIYTIRTTVGRERAVIETLSNKVKNMGSDIKAILHPQELRGYMFIEGEAEAIENAIAGVPHIRGLIRKKVSVSEIKRFIEVKAIEIKVNRSDIVEVVSGPFKNEKGKVTRVDAAKDEVTLELLEAAIPIPITVKTESIRVLEKGEEKE
jgi:transcriptional antiterminator NusG